MFDTDARKFYHGYHPHSLDEFDDLIEALLEIRHGFLTESDYEDELYSLAKAALDAREEAKKQERERANNAPKRAAIGFVYLMRNARNSLVKIGFSKQPKFREKTFQSEEPEVTIICAHKGTIGNEKELHSEYSEHRVRGEWFRLSDSQIECISAKIMAFKEMVDNQY